jgi:cytochrome c biogenesis protein CcdA
MFGLDDKIASFSDGTTTVSTLVASGKERAARTAGRLGLAWGFGHATTLFAFGLPVVLYSAYLPERVQSWAETSVGFVIVLLGALLLSRWRRGAFRHGHVHARRRARTSLQAYGIGLVHGMGGTAGVGLLLLATIQSRPLAIAALGLFAAFTAVSMAALSTGWGAALGAVPVQRSFNRVAPAIGITSLAFGVWYVLGAQGIVPYVL